MKKLLSIFLFFLSLSLFPQEKLIDFYNSLKKSETVLEGVIPVVNKKNDNLAIIILDAKKAYGYLIGNDFKIRRQLSSEDRSKKFKVAIGSCFSRDDEYRIYLSNKSLNEFSIVNFSFKDSITYQTNIALKLDNETFTQAITYKDKFYLITVTNESSILNIYSFDDDKYVKTGINLSKMKFTDRKNRIVLLSKLLLTRGYNNTVNIIGNDPNSINLGSKKSKFYFIKNRLILTLDQNNHHTQLLTIDLNTFKSQIRKFQKPLNKIKPQLVKTNSFIKDENLFIIALSKEKLVFTIQNFENGNLVKEYSTEKNEPITFKNTPIILSVSGLYGNTHHESEETRKYLRKLTPYNVDLGISVYKKNDTYKISLGGKEQLQVPGMASVMGLHKTEGFSSYTNSKLIYFEGLFDANFNHINGEIQKSVFDKIIDFKNPSDYSTKGKIVFKYKDYYIFGNYYYKSKKYILRKFND